MRIYETTTRTIRWQQAAMTLRGRSSNVPDVVVLSVLGLIADDAALAAHRAGTDVFDSGSRKALVGARDLLAQVQSFSAVTGLSWAALYPARPALMLEETFEHASRASGQTDTGVFIETLIGSIGSILAGAATTDEARSVAVFFDGLGERTLQAASVPRCGSRRMLAA